MAEFRCQCSLIRDMGMRVVEINDNKLVAVFEIYAATVLGLQQRLRWQLTLGAQ